MAGVQVDKVGLRIITDPTPLKGEGNLVQTAGIERGEADVYGLAKHVQAMAGNPAAIAPEHGVGMRRPVAGDHLKEFFGACGLSQVMEKVEQGWINGMDVSCPEIFQKIIDCGQGAGDMATISVIDDGQFFQGVGVIKREGFFFKAGQQGARRRE